MGENWTEADMQRHRQERPELYRDSPTDRTATEALAPTKDNLREAAIEAECTKLLAEDGWRPLRTDPVSDRARGKGFGELGMADHQYIRYLPELSAVVCKGADTVVGRFVLEAVAEQARGLALAQVLWIEFKRPGKKPKKHQRAWHDKERARGALTKIAGEDFPATVQGFKDWYETSGLMRRARWW